MSQPCSDSSCSKDGYMKIQAKDTAGWFCEDHYILAMMLGGKPVDTKTQQ